MTQTGQTGREWRLYPDVRENAMDRLDWLISLLVRTIGAERGRAARGGPGGA